MAALDSLDSLTDADREHLAPFLHAGPTTARSTALQYVKSDPVSKKEPQGRRILVAAVCVTLLGPRNAGPHLACHLP